MKKKAILFVLVLMCISTNAFSQNIIHGRITGDVQGGITVNIYVLTCGVPQPYAELTTDAQGYYTRGDVANGRYLVLPESTAYSFTPVASWVDIPQSESQPYDFTAITYMTILNNKIEIAANPNLAEWIPRISYNSVDDEFLVVWTEQGVREEGSSWQYGIVAQRLSSLGEKIGTSFGPAGNPVDNIILLPTPEYNMFSNEYLIAYTMSDVGFDEFGTMINNTGTIINPPFPISQKIKSQMHSRVAFNTLEKQYFVVYNSSETGSPDIKGVILDENGIPVTEELIINDTVGDQYNPYIVYNPTDNTYLINWEDFRNVPTWQQNGEIYGALLDSDGSVLVNDIAMIDDFGTTDEGDQRHNEIAYNEDKNEFFVCWSDMQPSMNNVGIRGRMIASDGTLAGPIFTVEDSPGPQMYPHPIYVPAKKQYFIQWEDGRNAEDKNAYWRDIYSLEIDIYGKWMSSNGMSFSDKIVFCDEPGVQRYSSISYSEKSDRILVAWMDVVDENLILGETDDQDGQHITEQGGNIYAAVYGPQEKIGVLFVEVGTPEGNEPGWYPQFFDPLYDVFFPGWFAGGPVDGGTCYTLIHYANEAEALICDVEVGTPIDVFCNEYTGTYPVESLVEFGVPEGDGSFEQDCFSPSWPFPYLVFAGHSTLDPQTGETILAPVIKDPEAAGIGIADFIEMSAFGRMDWLSRLPDYTDPHRRIALKFFYGNDAPGYASDSPEFYNVKDRLAELYPNTDIVYRHGWAGYMENLDAYGLPTTISDSTETAIDELIDEENVDRIIVYHTEAFYNNSSQYGHEWKDEYGRGVSAVDEKTFKECVEEIADDTGPATQEDIDTFLENKPWGKHWKHIFPLAESLIKEKAPFMRTTFVKPFGSYEAYEKAGVEMLKHAISKYNIPSSAALKVIVPSHGFYGAYMKAQDCDRYYKNAEELGQRLIARITSELEWSGKLEVTAASIEFAEGTYDWARTEQPAGKRLSVGEIIDASINGTYVNAMGQVVDNGHDNFDYIIMNMYGRTESQDSIYGMRGETLGNFVPSGGMWYERDDKDDDGNDYDSGDIDDEFFTVKVFDGSGWPSYPGCLEDSDGCTDSDLVYKGSAERSTTVIICGAITANPEQIGRKNFVEAAAESISEAITNPNLRGVK